MSTILAVIGFLVGIFLYAKSGMKDLLAPFLGAGAGYGIGMLVDLLRTKIYFSRHPKIFRAIFFILTVGFMGFTFYAYYNNIFAVLQPIRDIGRGSVIYGLIEMVFFPLVAVFGYFSNFGNFNVLLVFAYGCALFYGTIFAMMYAGSGSSSSAKHHEGKYRVLIDVATGEEVGEREHLNPYFEARKADVKTIICILIGALACPFLAYGVGFHYCLGLDQKSKKDDIIAAVIVGALTVLPYILLFVLNARG